MSADDVDAGDVMSNGHSENTVTRFEAFSEKKLQKLRTEAVQMVSNGPITTDEISLDGRTGEGVELADGENEAFRESVREQLDDAVEDDATEDEQAEQGEGRFPTGASAVVGLPIEEALDYRQAVEPEVQQDGMLTISGPGRAAGQQPAVAPLEQTATDTLVQPVQEQAQTPGFLSAQTNAIDTGLDTILEQRIATETMTEYPYEPMNVTAEGYGYGYGYGTGAPSTIEEPVAPVDSETGGDREPWGDVFGSDVYASGLGDLIDADFPDRFESE